MSTLPAFHKDVTGQYYGGAFWDSDDFRVRIETLSGTGEAFLLIVETSDGTIVGQSEISGEEVEGILKMASTDHDVDAYGDDWKFPEGLGRVLTWTMPTDDDHVVVLNEAHIDEIAAWFRYAIGLDTYDGGPDWEY